MKKSFLPSGKTQIKSFIPVSYTHLISRALGIKVDADSPAEERQKATLALRRAWNFDFNWSVLFSDQIFGEYKTCMGHASYAADGGDYDDRVSCPFEEPEDVLNFDPWAVYGAIDKAKAVSYTHLFSPGFKLPCKISDLICLYSA